MTGCVPRQRGLEIVGLWLTNLDDRFPGHEDIRATQGTALELLEGEIGETVENQCPSAFAHSLNVLGSSSTSFHCQTQ